MNDEIGDDPGLFSAMWGLLPHHDLDFKDRGFSGDRKAMAYNDHINRGMPLNGVKNFTDKNSSLIIYSTAREIGNIAAGYVAGINGQSWSNSRRAFDLLQGGVEPAPTRNAERFGFNVGAGLFDKKEASRAAEVEQNFGLIPHHLK